MTKKNPLISKIKKYILRRLHVLPVEEEVNNLSHQIWELQIAMVGACVEEYKAESSYILKNGVTIFPYDVIDEVPFFESGIDDSLQLPYVCHKGKRLYFPRTYSIEQCIGMYRSYIGEECLLGGHYREKQPHQYLTDTFDIEAGDVLIDVGCAEALLSLDSIEKVSRVYLFESDPVWIPALKATFKDYLEKVVIINKYVSDRDTETTITLESALREEHGKQLFIKMDIEGAEIEVLEGSREYLTERQHVKLVCCTYHKQHDAEDIPRLLTEMGYEYEFSDGYMLYYLDVNMQYPYFRRGLVRARK